MLAGRGCTALSRSIVNRYRGGLDSYLTVITGKVLALENSEENRPVNLLTRRMTVQRLSGESSGWAAGDVSKQAL